MKISIAGIVAVAGLSAGPVNPPAQRFEAQSTGATVILVPAIELNPHAVDSFPVHFNTLREASASSAGSRLNRLDDRVSNLKARADLNALRDTVSRDFDRLKALRANVAIALLKLRDPSLGLDAAEYGVSVALDELERAIEVIGGKFEELERESLARVS